MDAASPSRTLSFLDHSLALGRSLQAQGRRHDAIRVFSRLSGNRHLNAQDAEETRFRLGQMCSQNGDYRKARRHLSAVLTQQPHNPEYHFQMAEAISADENVSQERALKHLRRATRLDPENAEYWCELGLTALDTGKSEQGLSALRKAHEIAPDDVAVLEKVIEGLTYEKRYDEARSLVRAARFRHPRDPRFTKLWNDLNFQELLSEQQAGGIRFGVADSRPALLPFDPAKAKRNYRPDQAARLGAPHLGLTSDKKQIR